MNSSKIKMGKIIDCSLETGCIKFDGEKSVFEKGNLVELHYDVLQGPEKEKIGDFLLQDNTIFIAYDFGKEQDHRLGLDWEWNGSLQNAPKPNYTRFHHHVFSSDDIKSIEKGDLLDIYGLDASTISYLWYMKLDPEKLLAKWAAGAIKEMEAMEMGNHDELFEKTEPEPEYIDPADFYIPPTPQAKFLDAFSEHYFVTMSEYWKRVLRMHYDLIQWAGCLNPKCREVGIDLKKLETKFGDDEKKEQKKYAEMVRKKYPLLKWKIWLDVSGVREWSSENTWCVWPGIKSFELPTSMVDKDHQGIPIKAESVINDIVDIAGFKYGKRNKDGVFERRCGICGKSILSDDFSNITEVSRKLSRKSNGNIAGIAWTTKFTNVHKDKKFDFDDLSEYYIRFEGVKRRIILPYSGLEELEIPIKSIEFQKDALKNMEEEEKRRRNESREGAKREEKFNSSRFLNPVRDSEIKSINELIESEESIVHEKKETLKYDPSAGNKDEKIINSAMKTISGFANGDREGSLLIGVSDDKVVTGIEKDKFTTQDKYTQTFNNLCKLGLTPKSYFSSIKIKYYEAEGKTVFVIFCPPREKNGKLVFWNKIAYRRTHSGSEAMGHLEIQEVVEKEMLDRTYADKKLSTSED